MGKPIIFYPLIILIKSKLFKYIFVTSDDNLIINHINRNFPKVKTIKREKKFSTDKVKTITVIKNFIKKMNNKKVKNICCVYPATPFLNEKNLKTGFRICKKYKKFVFPVLKSNLKNGKFLELKKNSIQKILLKNNIRFNRYQDSGQFYWGTLQNWLKKKSIIDTSSKCFVLKKHEAIDINTNEDWNKAKKLYKRKK